MPRKRRSYPAELKAREEALGHHRSLCAARFLDTFEGSRSCYDVRDKSALVQTFGPDVANRAEEAFRRIWRSTRPLAWSARSAETKNEVPGNWIPGLVGVSAEAATLGWSTRLSPEDVDKQLHMR